MKTKELKRFWRTPVSCVKSLDFVSCGMAASLEVTVLETRDSEPFGKDLISYRFSWRSLDVLAYRVLNEEHAHPGQDQLVPGDVSSWTYEINGSKWIADLRAKGDISDDHAPDLRHFVILSHDYIVDVLSDKEPLCTVV